MEWNTNDSWEIGGRKFASRFILGSGKYDLKLIKAAVENAGAEMLTVAVRRAADKEQEDILGYIPKSVTLLPNTSGAKTAEDALRFARMARELGCGDFIKLEIMQDTKYLLPDNRETIRATEMLVKENFVVMPYMLPDLTAIMPLAAPIGSNRGLVNLELIKILLAELDCPIIVDAGIGKPSEACTAMELGCTAIMANTALATAGDIPRMVAAFAGAIRAGREAHLAGLGRVLVQGAAPSSPTTGVAAK